MKKAAVILFFLVFGFTMRLHSQISTFVKKYNTQEVTPNSSSVIRKSTLDKKYLTTGNGFMLLAEINEFGDTIKTSKIIPYNGGIGGTIINDAEDTLWFNARRLNAPPTFRYEYLLSKLNANYTPIYSKIYSSPIGHLILNANSFSDTTFLVKGVVTANSSLNSAKNLALIKADKNGDTLWCKEYNSGTAEEILSINQLSNNSYILAGGTNAIDTGDVFLAKIDNNGNIVWAQNYGGSLQDGAWINFTNNNFLYTYAASNSFFGTNANGLFFKTDTLGNLIWAKSISCPNGFAYTDGNYDVNKGLLTIAGISNYNILNWGFLAMQIDTNGVVVNNKKYEFSPDDDYALSFVKMNDAGYLFTLSEYNNSILAYDTKIFKTDSLFNSGCLPNTTLSFTTTDVTALMHVNTLTMVASPLYIDVIDTVTFGSGRGCDIQTECNGFVGVEDQEKQENIFNIYPNPANDVVYFDYQLPEKITQATVNVYNYAGILVQSFIIYGNEGAATQNVSGLSNGLYMFSIISNNTSIAQQKIIINK